MTAINPMDLIDLDRSLDQPLKLEDYQAWVEDLRVPAGKEAFPVLYTIIGLVAEAGEVLENLQKVMRYGHLNYDKDKIKDELSDVFYYAVAACSDLGFTFEEVLNHNIAKLNARHKTPK